MKKADNKHKKKRWEIYPFVQADHVLRSQNKTCIFRYCATICMHSFMPACTRKSAFFSSVGTRIIRSFGTQPFGTQPFRTLSSSVGWSEQGAKLAKMSEWSSLTIMEFSKCLIEDFFCYIIRILKIGLFESFFLIFFFKKSEIQPRDLSKIVIMVKNEKVVSIPTPPLYNHSGTLFHSISIY